MCNGNAVCCFCYVHAADNDRGAGRRKGGDLLSMPLLLEVSGIFTSSLSLLFLPLFGGYLFAHRTVNLLELHAVCRRLPYF